MMSHNRPELYKAYLANNEHILIVNTTVYDTTISAKKRALIADLNNKIGNNVVTGVKFIRYINE